MDPVFYLYPPGPVTPATNNFGIEAWVRSSQTTPVNGLRAALVYNGRGEDNGFGLYQVGVSTSASSGWGITSPSAARR